MTQEVVIGRPLTAEEINTRVGISNGSQIAEVLSPFHKPFQLQPADWRLQDRLPTDFEALVQLSDPPQPKPTWYEATSLSRLTYHNYEFLGKRFEEPLLPYYGGRAGQNHEALKATLGDRFGGVIEVVGSLHRRSEGGSIKTSVRNALSEAYRSNMELFDQKIILADYYKDTLTNNLTRALLYQIGWMAAGDERRAQIYGNFAEHFQRGNFLMGVFSLPTSRDGLMHVTLVR